MRSLGCHGSLHRNVFLLEVESLELPPFELPSRYFSCLCLLDARSASTGDIGKFSVELLRYGCAYFCAWGPRCERVHDIMDEEIVGNDPPKSSFGHVMTTWHDSESLSEALDFFLTLTFADTTLAGECESALIISIASSEWSNEVKRLVSPSNAH